MNNVCWLHAGFDHLAESPVIDRPIHPDLTRFNMYMLCWRYYHILLALQCQTRMCFSRLAETNCDTHMLSSSLARYPSVFCRFMVF